MNQPWLNGKWNEMKGKIKEQWGELTNDDLDKVQGQRDQLVGRIQQRYGKTREAIETEVSAWEERNGLR
ncbi:MAG TPA: CsbD family protein [Thermoanaerobaculia bacterium]|nr:CsbD family protein [Thermoanaerobaculia bacterium]